MTARSYDVATHLSHDAAMAIAATEYERFVDQLLELDEHDWTMSTDCPDWDVRLVAIHVLSVCERASRVLSSLNSFRRARAEAKRVGLPPIDIVNAREIAQRADLSPTEVVERLGRAIAPVMERRKSLPRPIGAIRLPTTTGWETLATIYDLVYTRDTWMHRIDIARASGRDPRVSTSHDGKIVGDLIAAWEKRHDDSLDLVLEGTAGGRYSINGGGREVRVGAVDFGRFLAGRTDISELTWAPVMF